MSFRNLFLSVFFAITPVTAMAYPQITFQCDDVDNVIVVGNVATELNINRELVIGAKFRVEISNLADIEIRCIGDTATISGYGVVYIQGQVEVVRQ
jgi:hypothetical protein